MGLFDMFPPHIIAPMVKPAVEGLIDSFYEYAKEKYEKQLRPGEMLTMVVPKNPADNQAYYIIAKCAMDFSTPLEVLESKNLMDAIDGLNLQELISEANGE